MTRFANGCREKRLGKADRIRVMIGRCHFEMVMRDVPLRLRLKEEIRKKRKDEARETEKKRAIISEGCLCSCYSSLPPVAGAPIKRA